MLTMNPPTDRLAELRRAYLFANMAPAHLQTLVNGMQDLRLKAGDNLFRHGQPAERFFSCARAWSNSTACHPTATRRSSRSCARAKPSPRR